jgi:poly(A) polymerase Pap1
MAGYGFLTQKDIDIINLQKSLHNDPVIQQQMIRAQTIDIQTMKWALAQGNMFQKKAYYNVYDLTNMCQNPNQQPGWTR